MKHVRLNRSELVRNGVFFGRLDALDRGTSSMEQRTLKFVWPCRAIAQQFSIYMDQSLTHVLMNSLS